MRSLLSILFAIFLITPAQAFTVWDGGNDNNGILWQAAGDFYVYSGNNIVRTDNIYVKLYPSIDSQSVGKEGSGIAIPEMAYLAPGAMEEYQRLMGISKIKIVDTDQGRFVTREYL